MGNEGSFFINIFAGADELFRVVVVFRPNGLAFENQVKGRAEYRTAADLFGLIEIDILRIHEIEIPIPPPKSEAFVILAVIRGETAEFYIQFHRGLNDNEHKEVKFPGLVYEVEQLFVFAFKVLFEIAGIKIDRSFVKDDVEFQILFHFVEISFFPKDFHEFAEVLITAFFIEFRKVFGNDSGIRLFGKIEGKENAEIAEIGGNVVRFVSMEFLYVGKQVQKTVVVVNVV